MKRFAFATILATSRALAGLRWVVRRTTAGLRWFVLCLAADLLRDDRSHEDRALEDSEVTPGYESYELGRSQRAGTAARTASARRGPATERDVGGATRPARRALRPTKVEAECRAN